MAWPPDGTGRSAAGRPAHPDPATGSPDDASYGSGLPGPVRRRASVWHRVVTALVALVSVLVLAVSGGGWLLLRYYDGRVHHVPLAFSPSDRRPARAAGRTQNILLVGSDSRAGTDGEFGEVAGQRSDTTILAHLDADGSTTLVSFPRDLWMTIPAYSDSAGHRHADHRSKLNAAFALGGPSLLVATMEALTQLRIDHYLQIDFVGFQRITDALGGVTVCIRPLPGGSRSNLDDRMSGWHGHVGDNTLNGEQALAFVRQRYGLPEGDLDRIRRQQQFIGVVFRSATSTGTLTDPGKVASLLDAVTSSITVDNGTSLADLRLLAVRLQGIGTGDVRFETVPATPGQAGGQAVLLTDPGRLASFLAGIGGPRPAVGAAPAKAAVVAPVVTRTPVVTATMPVPTAPGGTTTGSCTY